MNHISSSDDLNPKLMDFEGSRLVLSESNISSSELPVNVPHLQIEKIYMDDGDFSFAKLSMSSGSSVAGLLHICDNVMMVGIGKSGKLPTRQEIRSEDLADLQSGTYFCIWNTTPVRINTSKRRTTVKYPLVFLFRNEEKDEDSYINIFSDEQYQAWFPIFLPHAIKLMGANLDDCFSNTLDNTLAQFGNLNALFGQFFLTHVDSNDGSVCRFRVTITKEPLESDPVRVIPIVKKGLCIEEQCEDFGNNSGLFVFDEWLLKWPV